MPERAPVIAHNLDPGAACARLAQLVADYAFTFRADADGPAALEWLACKLDEIAEGGGTPTNLADWDAHIHPDDRSAVAEARLGTADAGIDYRLIADNGPTRWIRETIGVDEDESGDARRVWVAGFDHSRLMPVTNPVNARASVKDAASAHREVEAEIAERRRVEQALHESEQYNRLLFESLPIGLALCRMNGEFVDFNTAFARILGRSAKDIRGKTHADMTPAEYAAIERVQLDRLERTGRNGPYEKAFVHADGHRVPVRISGMILHRGGDRFIWSSVEDIAEQKHAEEGLRESNKKYRSLFDTSRDGIKFTTLDGMIEEANQAYLDMIGYTLDELRRVEYRKLTPLRWWPIESDIIANQVMRRGYSDEYEKEYIRKDGTVFPVQVRLWLVRDDHGRPARFFGIFRDITERKRHEQAIRHRHAQLAHVSRLTTVGEMAAGLAHELNQPLSALTNYAHGCLRRLQSGKADEDMIKTALEHITVQAARASEIIRRVRSFVGKDDQRRADTDVNELVHHGLDMVDLDLRRHAVTVEVDLAPDLPKPHVDAVQIEQVIINLLLNGIEAMRQHRTAEPRFHVRTSHERGAINITITDNGPGIDPAVVDQIFDPFFTTKERGMGMGLSICRSIIEQHGGRLWAEQAPTGGAVFTFLLPASEGGQAYGI